MTAAPSRPEVPAGGSSPQRIVVLTHGVETSPSTAASWMPALAGRIDHGDVAVAQYRYGKLSFWAVGLPFVGPIVRAHHVTAFQKFVAELCRRYPESEIDFIGHSFGCYLGFESMRAPGAFRPFWRKMLLMAPAVSSRETFEDVAGHYQKIECFHSDNDEVIKFSDFGQAGYRGFAYAGNFTRVENDDMTPFGHHDYTLPGKAWDAACVFLKD